MTKGKVYIETSVISYLTAKPSRDLIVAAQQEITRNWWENETAGYELFISQSVLNEASAGDKEAANLRIQKLKDLSILDIDNRVLELTKAIMASGIIPEKAGEDAIHISVATVHKIDFLLTWNCKHIANANINNQLRKIINNIGYEMPVICTPNELIGE